MTIRVLPRDSGIRAARVLFLAALAAVAGGCAVPHFERQDKHSDAVAGAPDMGDVVTHLQCEIAEVLDAARADDPAFKRLLTDDYVAYASLTLDVVENEGLTPSLAFLTPFPVSGSGFQRSIGLGAQLSDERHRNMTQTFSLLVDPTYRERAAKEKRVLPACPELASRLRGSLDLRQVIAEGLRTSRPEDFLLPLVGDNTPEGGRAGLTSDQVPNFGATIEFTLTYGADLDPTWTLKRFTGVGGGSPGFLNGSRVVKDSLAISFASAAGASSSAASGPAATPAAAARIRADAQQTAGKAAQDAVTRMILQQIIKP